MNIAIVIVSLVLLITLHELGHFLVAKFFDVKIEEFGIGIPPRIIGKKVGETLYSINLIPLGGFVRMMGEEERVDHERSFSEKPIWQRSLIIVAGVVSFWIIAAAIFAIVAFNWGVLNQVEDDVPDGRLIAGLIAEEAPEEITSEDEILSVNGEEVSTKGSLKEQLEKGSKNITFQSVDEKTTISFKDYTPQEIIEILDVRRVAREQYSFIESIEFGVDHTIFITKMQASGIYIALKSFVTGQDLPDGMEFGGPVMIGGMATDALGRGAGEYLMFVGIIATILAFMNILPIPALDGGHLLFLLIEKIKGSPITEKVQQKVTLAFFVLLVSLMVIITIRDVLKIF